MNTSIMKYKNSTPIFSCLLCALAVALSAALAAPTNARAQEAQAAQETQEVPAAQTEGQGLGEEFKKDKYTGGSWFYNTPSGHFSGASFFSLGYDYFFENTDIKLTLFDIGNNGSFYLQPAVRFLFYSVFEIGMGYLFSMPPNEYYYEMEHVGNVSFSFFPRNMKIINDSQFGIMRTRYDRESNRLMPFLMYRNITSFNYMLVNKPLIRVDLNASFVYDYSVEYKESFYDLYADLTILQDHYYGEFAIKPFITYNDSIGTVSKIKDAQNFVKLTSFSIFGDPTLYNFAVGALAEYRFFFLKFLGGHQPYEDMYLSVTYSLGYINDKYNSDPKIVQYYGGGLGFDIMGMVPLSVQFIADDRNNIGFSVFTSIAPEF